MQPCLETPSTIPTIFCQVLVIKSLDFICSYWGNPRLLGRDVKGIWYSHAWKSEKYKAILEGAVKYKRNGI